MLRSKNSISKTEWTDTFAYCPDASELFSFSSGSVMFQLSLPSAVRKGVYALCDGRKYFTDYLLFSVNQAGQFFDYPGIYAALSPHGIIFTIWTEYGKFSIFDVQTDLSANESFVLKFCWDNSGNVLGSGATMAIFVNEVCTSAGNFPIKSEDMSYLNFYAFDSKNLDFSLICSIQDFACFSAVPISNEQQVTCLTSYRFDDDQITLVGRAGATIFVDGLDGEEIETNKITCFGASSHCADVCDLTGHIYFCSFFNDSYTSGAVSKFDVFSSGVTKILRSLTSPRALAVIQREGIDYPKGFYYDDSVCKGVWVATSDRILRTDQDLAVQLEFLGVLNPTCVTCQNDDSVWIADYGHDLVKHVSYGCSLLHSIPIVTPAHIFVNMEDEVFVYSTLTWSVYKIVGGVVTDFVMVGSGVVAVSGDPKSNCFFVAHSNGLLERYSNDLLLETSGNPTEHIDSICVRRGALQQSVIVVDVQGGVVVETSSKYPGAVVQSVEFSDSILFNGGICSTAKSVGATGEMIGTFSLDFTVGTGAVVGVKSNAFKVDKRNVDVSDGGARGAYHSLFEISPDVNPTDEPEGVVKSSEL